MSMLELGRTKRQKRTALGVLAGVNLVALLVVVSVFVRFGADLPVGSAVLAVLAIAGWLFTFVLLIINLAYYLMPRNP